MSKNKQKSSTTTQSMFIADKIFVLFFPYFFIITSFILITDLATFLPKTNILFYLVVLFVGVINLIFVTIQQQERFSKLNNTRFLIIIFILIHLGFMIFTKGSFLKKALPNIFEVLLLLAVFCQWAWTGRFYASFIERENLLKTVKNKKSFELFESLRDEGLLTADIKQERKAANSTRIILSLILIFLFFISYLAKIKISNKALMFGFLFFLFSKMLKIQLNLYDEEQNYASMGLDKTFGLTIEKTFLAFLLLSILALITFFISSNNVNVNLPFKHWLDKFLSWLKTIESKNHLPRRQPPAISLPSGDFGKSMGEGVLVEKTIVENNNSFEIIKKIALWLAIISFLFFLLKPFFTKAWRDFWKDKKLKILLEKIFKSIASFFNKIKTFFVNLFLPTKNRILNKSKSRKEFKKAFGQKIKNKKSKAKQREIGILTKEFLKLIDWGAEKSIIFTANLSPSEYCKKLAQKIFEDKNYDLPNNKKTNGIKLLEKVAFYFEKALYSPFLLTKEEIEIYFFVIEVITKEE